MTIERLQLLRNIGQFDSVAAGAQIPLAPLSLIYAENGRGKTTLATIFRSLSSGNGSLLEERRRLGSAHPPHIVVTARGGAHTFQNGTWSATYPDVAVFDDAFVAANVCSGITIEATHKQKLHELILGSRGVALNSTLQRHVARVEEHNRAIREKGDAVPAGPRGNLTVDAFCALAPDPAIDDKIELAQRRLSAAQAADTIRSRSTFEALSLPAFDAAGLNALLARGLPELGADAAARVRTHLLHLGRGGEAWVSDGMPRMYKASEDEAPPNCPFCAQSVQNSPLIEHYQTYFSDAYRSLRAAINETGININATHAGDVPAAFERSVRVASENREFWRSFIDVPDVNVDTAAIVRAWNSARNFVIDTLRTKAAAPLEAVALSPQCLAAIATYDAHRTAIASLSADLLSCNAAIAIVKEQAASANIITLRADSQKLSVIKARYETEVARSCTNYIEEKELKKATEALRDQARADLDRYRGGIFQTYENAINIYLGRFNAGFRLGSVTSVNNRGGSSVTYSVLINNVAVSLSADEGPSFKNTLSAGDRNTLALAFFFASLDQDARLQEKIVIIDDPMTSLDEHRRLTTVQEMHRLCGRVRQMIVLSHSKSFLCAVWEGADRVNRCALRISRDGRGSSLAVWDVRQDKLTPHDRRHELVREYIANGDPAKEREVAAALRPILEAFMRVAHPSTFPPGTLLGPYIGLCQQRHGHPNEILSLANTTALRALLDYANRFHHDSNPAWETAAINDQELLSFATQTIAFASR